MKGFRTFRRTFSSSTESVLLDICSRKVATITLNKPAVHNAFSEEVISSLTEKLIQVEKSEARVLVLQSNGKNFSAGADLEYMKKLGSYTRENNFKDAMKLSDLFDKLSKIQCPTVAAVQGASFGGALGLISACDIAICEEKSKFCFSEVKLGLIPATISPFVVRKIGLNHAKKLFLTAEIFDAATAQRIGLVHDIGELQEGKEKYIEMILKNGPHALKMTKALLKVVEYDIAENVRKDTAELLAEIRSGEEAKEGLSSFLEKRKPSYAS